MKTISTSLATLLTVKGNQPLLFTDLATSFTDPHTTFAPFEQTLSSGLHLTTFELANGISTYTKTV